MRFSLYSIIALFGFAILFTGCKSDSPGSVAKKFLDDLNHMNYDGAKEVATEETRNMIDMLAQFSTMMPDSIKEEAKKIKVSIKEEKILTDTTAYVIYTTSDNDAEQKLSLVKRNVATSGREDLKWLAQWTKNDQQLEEESDELFEMEQQPAPAGDSAELPAAQPTEAAN